MLLKCDAKCDARLGIRPHLWLRNGVFYCRIELPRVEGKRRYSRYSLHTTDYYEALTKMVEINDFNKKFDRLCKLYSEIKLVKHITPSSSSNYGFILNIPDEWFIAKDNDPQTMAEFIKVYGELNQNIGRYSVQKEVLDRLKSMEDKYKLLKKTFGPELFKKLGGIQIIKPPKHTLQYMLDSMLVKASNGEAETKRKKHFFEDIFKQLKLSFEDDYSKFHTIENIQKLSESIANQKDIQNDNKRQKLRYIKEFVGFACDLEPDFYKKNILVSIPKIEKTKKSERQPHLPYSETQLKEIFNPKHTFFSEEPDMFWICMIALFTGSRANATMTLQYNNVVKKDDLWCIHFSENHAIKHLKNDASERFVPIHKQLLDLGFVDYVERKKSKLNAKDEDFIFSKCITKGGQYNNKYLDRYLFKFLKDIDVKDKGYDFHSFRKNASLAMQSARLIPTIINAIIGWEGKDTMEQSYSNYGLNQINEELNKFSYAYLQDEFKHWKKVMKKKPESKK